MNPSVEVTPDKGQYRVRLVREGLYLVDNAVRGRVRFYGNWKAPKKPTVVSAKTGVK